MANKKLTQNQQTILNRLSIGHIICRCKSTILGYEYLYDYSLSSNDNISFALHLGSYNSLIKKGLLKEVEGEKGVNYVTFRATLIQ